MIRGKFIQLINLETDFYLHFYRWFLDKEAIKYSLNRWQKKHTKEQIKQWLADTLSDPKVVNFGIVERSTKKLIGYAGIREGKYHNKIMMSILESEWELSKK